MALVAYSDSETSDTEEAPVAPAPTPKPTAAKGPFNATFQKSSEPRKIKVDLPAPKPEPVLEQQDEHPPAKRARTAGAFSGFNRLLPAPKRPAQSGPKPGVSLKTSSEAAFSRAPVDPVDDYGDQVYGNAQDSSEAATAGPTFAKDEPKIIGKATKFRPLSVANKKKPAKKAKAVEDIKSDTNGQRAQQTNLQTEDVIVEPAPPPPKPKKSLFSVPQADEGISTSLTTDTYESMTTKPPDGDSFESTPQHTDVAAHTSSASNSNSLQSLASDLNLTPAQRRQLFGRNAKDTDVNIAHFNMDNEYAANEQLRQAGEVVEHRAVKSIAPGKHSLQQLVNNARSQQEGLQDKWAEGRRERGEGSSKYGWGR